MKSHIIARKATGEEFVILVAPEGFEFTGEIRHANPSESFSVFNASAIIASPIGTQYAVAIMRRIPTRAEELRRPLLMNLLTGSYWKGSSGSYSLVIADIERIFREIPNVEVAGGK